MIAELTETIVPQPIPTPPNPMESKPPIAVKPNPYVFDWLTTLEELVGGRILSGAQRMDLEIRARQWPTCACGQLCRGLPRTDFGMPTDSLLRYAGSRFAVYIEDGRWSYALKTFHEIEARTSFLLDEKESYPDRV